MKLLSSLFVSALFAASASAALADTITVDSYGTGASAGAANNSALTYIGSQSIGYTTGGVPYANGPFVGSTSSTTYNLTTGISPWTSALSGSSWVAQNQNDSPGGGHVETNNMAYLFDTIFTDNNAAKSTGSITLMADDTAAVYLNGHLVVPAATDATAGTCASGTPNCTVPVTFVLPTMDFVSGANVLQFAVLQEHGSAEGLDFTGNVNVTPEPNSLLLLGTGLSMLAGFAYSRRVQA